MWFISLGASVNSVRGGGRADGGAALLQGQAAPRRVRHRGLHHQQEQRRPPRLQVPARCSQGEQELQRFINLIGAMDL